MRWLLALVVVILVSTACGADPGDDGARELNSVMVGSDVLISSEASGFVELAGLASVATAEELTVFWAAESDRSVTAMAASTSRLADIVDQLDDSFSDVIDPAVRSTYAPYLRAYREILDALDDVRIGIVDADQARRADGIADYGREIGALESADRVRLDRVIVAYGPEEARRLLALERGDS